MVLSGFYQSPDDAKNGVETLAMIAGQLILPLLNKREIFQYSSFFLTSYTLDLNSAELGGLIPGYNSQMG